MSLICILPEFLDGLRLGMLTNYAKTLKMILLLNIKSRISCGQQLIRGDESENEDYESEES